MIEFAACCCVSRKDETAGGIERAISAIKSSESTPGPLGMSDTNPIPDAPAEMASLASATLLIQQIFTNGCDISQLQNGR